MFESIFLKNKNYKKNLSLRQYKVSCSFLAFERKSIGPDPPTPQETLVVDINMFENIENVNDY